MDGLPGLDSYVNYKEDSLNGGSLYRGNTVFAFSCFVLRSLSTECKPLFKL
jgi:hypothetical protein